VRKQAAPSAERGKVYDNAVSVAPNLDLFPIDRELEIGEYFKR